MSESRTLDWIAFALMVMLCASWGFQQVTIKWALPEVGPMLQGTVRSGGAAAAILAASLWRRGDLRIDDGTLGPGLLAGLLFGVEFLLLYLSLLYTDAARVILFLYTAPFVVALGSHLVLRAEHLSPDRWLGIAVAFAGLALALAPWQRSGLDRPTLTGDLMAVTAGILWGATTLVIKGSALRRADPVKVLLYQLVVSIAILGGGAAVAGEGLAWPLTAVSWFSLVYQTVWVGTVTFPIWFALIARYPPARLSVLTFMTPLMGAVFGHFLLGERLTWTTAVAVGLVMVGIVLVNRPAAKA